MEKINNTERIIQKTNEFLTFLDIFIQENPEDSKNEQKLKAHLLDQIWVLKNAKKTIKITESVIIGPYTIGDKEFALKEYSVDKGWHCTANCYPDLKTEITYMERITEKEVK